MFIVWQSGQDVVRGGDYGEQHCGNCGRECPHAILVRYKYTDFYWCLGLVTGHDYFVACDRCNAAMQISKAEAQQHIASVPIPFMRRFGCLLAVATVAVFAVVANLAK